MMQKPESTPNTTIARGHGFTSEQLDSFMTSFSSEQSLQTLLTDPTKRSFTQRLIFRYLECLPDNDEDDEDFDPFSDETDEDHTPNKRIRRDWSRILLKRLPDGHDFERENLLDDGVRFFCWCARNLRTREDASLFLGYMRKFAELCLLLLGQLGNRVRVA